MTVTQQSVVHKYNSKMGGEDLLDRMKSYYWESVQTKKYFTDLALANSWLCYYQNNIECGTPREGTMQFLELLRDFGSGILEQVWHWCCTCIGRECTPCTKRKKIRSLQYQMSLCTAFAKHLPEIGQADRPREKGFSGKSCVQCVTCNEFPCLQTEHNCFETFHTGQ